MKAPLPNARSLARSILDEPSEFIRRFWRKHPMLRPGAATDLQARGDFAQILSYLGVPIIFPLRSVSLVEANRKLELHASIAAAGEAVSKGSVVSIKVSSSWQREYVSDRSIVRELYEMLCDELGLDLVPATLLADVDVFWTGKGASIGTHFDSSDVFAIQLSGKRMWTVESTQNVQLIQTLATDRQWNRQDEASFFSETQEYILEPGDVLYVPAYAVHHVSGDRESISLSVGIKAFNELDVVRYLLDELASRQYRRYPPASGLNSVSSDDRAVARAHLLQKVRTALSTVEMAAAAILLSDPKASGVEPGPDSPS
jgi:ribosomal protein L16 Arg81 hydroxylase